MAFYTCSELRETHQQLRCAPTASFVSARSALAALRMCSRNDAMHVSDRNYASSGSELAAKRWMAGEL